MDERETSEGYRAVVVRLDARWRVIDSRERYPYRQWILQRREGAAWRGVSFSQNRAGLQRAVREKVGCIGKDAERVLGGLPALNLGQKSEERG